MFILWPELNQRTCPLSFVWAGGVSGAVNSQYQWQAYAYTGKTSGGIHTVHVPRPKRRFTLFPVVGFLFG